MDAPVELARLARSAAGRTPTAGWAAGSGAPQAGCRSRRSGRRARASRSRPCSASASAITRRRRAARPGRPGGPGRRGRRSCRHRRGGAPGRRDRSACGRTARTGRSQTPPPSPTPSDEMPPRCGTAHSDSWAISMSSWVWRAVLAGQEADATAAPLVGGVVESAALRASHQHVLPRCGGAPCSAPLVAMSRSRRRMTVLDRRGSVRARGRQRGGRRQRTRRQPWTFPPVRGPSNRPGTRRRCHLADHNSMSSAARVLVTRASSAR